MSCKKPSLKGMKNTGYLGHFAKDKFIQQGHNDSGRGLEEEYERRELSRKRIKIGDRMVDRHNDHSLRRIDQDERDFQETRALNAERLLEMRKPPSMEERLEEREKKRKGLK